MSKEPTPVTILSGFLGSGKTTLLQHILLSPDHKHKIAVIVNDMATLNIDAELVQHTTTRLVQAEREVISLQNGCICCTLRGDLIREIAQIRRDNEFDYILIESTGIAEPQQVAEAFCFDPMTAQLAKSEEEMLWTQARLDTCVTVVDAHNFAFHASSLQQFSDSYHDGLDTTTPEGLKEGEKSIATLLIDQVEFANVILLNKTDLVSPEELANTRHLVEKLNPLAKIIPTEFAKVDLQEVLNTSLFDMKEAAESAGWLLSLKEEQPKSEIDEYGVSSFVYRSRKPFHPKRLAQWIDEILHYASEWKNLSVDVRQQQSDEKYEAMLDKYGNILRAKGFVWVAGSDSYMLGIAQSGRVGGLTPIMPWYALIPEDQWGVKDPKDLATIHSKFEEPHGDRRQEIVFIGTNLNPDALCEALDACVLSEQELKRYKFYNDTGYQ